MNMKQNFRNNWNKANFFGSNIKATNDKGFDIQQSYFYKVMQTTVCLVLRIKLS
jgi:hypothetical protein